MKIVILQYLAQQKTQEHGNGETKIGKPNMNKFTELVESLDSGELTLTHIQIAYREHIRNSKDIPDEGKSILCGEGNNSGLLYKHFALISNLVGGMELAVRRAKDSPVSKLMERG